MVNEVKRSLPILADGMLLHHPVQEPQVPGINHIVSKVKAADPFRARWPRQAALAAIASLQNT